MQRHFTGKTGLFQTAKLYPLLNRMALHVAQIHNPLYNHAAWAQENRLSSRSNRDSIPLAKPERFREAYRNSPTFKFKANLTFTHHKQTFILTINRDLIHSSSCNSIPFCLISPHSGATRTEKRRCPTSGVSRKSRSKVLTASCMRCSLEKPAADKP